MAKVAQLHDNLDRTRYIVLKRENVIGRAPEVNILVDNNVVSRRHARIACLPGTSSFFIEDISARGTYVNFRRIQGRRPLKEGDRICVIRFHNVHPKDIAAMTPEQLKTYCDDPRVDGIKAVADFTFGYVEVSEAQAGQVEKPPEDEKKPQGLLAKLKSLFSKKP